MYLNVRNVLGIAALCAAAAASWYWGLEDAARRTGPEPGTGGPLGYYLRDAQISIMDAEGRVLYEISAAAVEERPAENRTVLDRVVVKYSPTAEVPWEVRADSGEIPSDERFVDLSGAVELASTETTGETTIIRAPRIRFAPDDYLATTDSPVSVSLGAERLEAVGMNANLKGDFLELESSVHGQFNP